jgi:nickel-dependent lactate racemase
VGGHRAFLTARMLQTHKVYALTSLDPDLLRRLHFIPIESVAQGIAAAREDHGMDMKTLVVPNGKVVLPLLNGKVRSFSDLGG